MELNKHFQVQSSTGFFPDVPPLSRLPEYFTAWEDLLDDLHRLLNAKRLREEVDNNLPLLVVSDGDLPTERHWMRARKILTFLSQGYLWQEGREGAVSVLPKQLAIPWWEVSNRLGLPPVATYAHSVLWNWKLKDPNAPVTFDNIQMDFTYTNTTDEVWFYQISVAVEFAAVDSIHQSRKCLQDMSNGHVANVIECLVAVHRSICKMTEALVRMYEQCNPDFFYNDIRKFQAGSKGMKAFPNGLIFEGVDNRPMGFIGASAGQSSTLPVLDILLGVEHVPQVREFFDVQRWHMPRPHRQFLMMLSQQPKLREFVLVNKSNTELCDAYNRCVQALADFRTKHVVLVTTYIVTPAGKAEGVKTEGGLATRGTGGSNFMVLLKTSRDNTLNCLVS